MHANPVVPPEDSAPTGVEPDINARLLHFAITQAVKNSWTVWVICAFIAMTFVRHTPQWITFVWLAAICLAYALRAAWLNPARHLDALTASQALWRRRFNVSTLAAALIVAIGPAMVFPHVPEGVHMYITMVLCCWLAGAMAVFGPTPRLYAGYTLLFMGGTALGWVSVESRYLLDIVSMLTVYALVVTGFCHSFGRLIYEGMSIRNANEALVTEMRKSKEAAEESSRAKTRFLAVASHDLRQPLHALTLLNGLLGRAHSVERAAEVSGQMSRSLRTLDHLFTSLLDFSRLDSAAIEPEKQWQACDELVEHAIQPLQATALAKGLQLRYDGADFDLHTDPDLFGRMLRNLADNGIKFTSVGRVLITAEAGLDRSCVISVVDTGRGIPENLRGEVFKEYFQTTEGRGAGGLGLGLAIVQRLAHLLGARVRVTDNPGGGTRFDLLMPPGSVRPREARDPAELANVSRPTPLQSLAVLCIDDDADSLSATAQLLRSWGMQVVCAGSAAEALALARSQPFIDVILSDHQLGDGLTGNELIYQLRHWIGEVSAALITGDAQAMQAHKAGQIEFPVLAKPLAPAELRQLLEVFQEFE